MSSSFTQIPFKVEARQDLVRDTIPFLKRIDWLYRDLAFESEKCFSVLSSIFINILPQRES